MVYYNRVGDVFDVLEFPHNESSATERHPAMIYKICRDRYNVPFAVLLAACGSDQPVKMPKFCEQPIFPNDYEQRKLVQMVQGWI